MKFSVGLAQIAPALGDVAANLDLHLEAVRDAQSRGVDLLVFPELSLTGYNLGDRAFDVAIRADAADPTFSALLEASAEIDLVVSFVEVDERHRLFISAVYLSACRVVHRHRKIYLPTYGLWAEGKTYAAGDAVRAFDTRFGRAGILICEDFWHASLPYLLWQDGADLLILISASVEHGEDEAEATAERVIGINRVYATLFTDFVIHVNQTGDEPGGRYWGGSTVFGPDARQLVEGPRYEAAIVTAEIDTAALGDARRGLPLLRDERPTLALRELQRIVGARRIKHGWDTDSTDFTDI